MESWVGKWRFAVAFQITSERGHFSMLPHVNNFLQIKWKEKCRNEAQHEQKFWSSHFFLFYFTLYWKFVSIWMHFKLRFCHLQSEVIQSSLPLNFYVLLLPVQPGSGQEYKIPGLFPSSLTMCTYHTTFPTLLHCFHGQSKRESALSHLHLNWTDRLWPPGHPFHIVLP